MLFSEFHIFVQEPPDIYIFFYLRQKQTNKQTKNNNNETTSIIWMSKRKNIYLNLARKRNEKKSFCPLFVLLFLLQNYLFKHWRLSDVYCFYPKSFKILLQLVKLFLRYHAHKSGTSRKNMSGTSTANDSKKKLSLTSILH